MKADCYSKLRLIACPVSSAFAGWPAPQPALRAFAARQATKTAYAVHENAFAARRLHESNGKRYRTLPLAFLCYISLETCRTAPMPGVISLRNHAGRDPLSRSVSFRAPRRRRSCRGHPTQTEGRDGAETPGEGRPSRAISVKHKEPHRDLQATASLRRLKRR